MKQENCSVLFSEPNSLNFYRIYVGYVAFGSIENCHLPVFLKAQAAIVSGIFRFDFIYRFTIRKGVEPL
jgi:hypothetical protein